MFSGEFLSSLSPLSGHLKAVLQREDELSGAVPMSVLIACDAKLGSLCKSINPRVKSNLFLSIPLIVRASVRLSDLIGVSEGELWIKRLKPYPSDLIASLVNQQSDMTSAAQIEAVYFPYSIVKDVQSISLNLHSREYYLDVIAQGLGLVDASKVLISRTVGKASSEMRLYFSALESHNLNPVSEFHSEKQLSSFCGSFNVRASYLLGQQVYGDAILASVGYTWRGPELFSEDVSLRSYFRMLVGKTPDGLYKLSREAILVAKLPAVFTTNANWRGRLPRDLLCAFCRQHRLSEPVFNVCNSYELDEVSPESCQKPASEGSNAGVRTASGGVSDTIGLKVLCEVKVYSKNQELILDCCPEDFFKKQGDAVQTTSLRVVNWLNWFFKRPHMPSKMLSGDAIGHDIRCLTTCFLKEFVFYQLFHSVLKPSDSEGGQNLVQNCMDLPDDMIDHELKHFNIEGPEFGASPSFGSIVCISYSVYLMSEVKEILENLESKDEFDFEIGVGAVIPCIETALLQMTVGQSVCLYMDLPSNELVLATAMDCQKVISFLSSKACFLKYSISLLWLKEPFEDRMEQALFSPPLSKQRVEYAMRCIKESSATTLIDFGCGSGSLLESLVDSPSSLEKIVGIDISQKGLVRAAKVLNSKLEKFVAMSPSPRIKSVILYEGSITVSDCRLFGFDIGTCLEVIEHMEEDQVSLFGDVALGQFRPKVLIVSTPNYEYNVILQKSNLANQEEDHDDKEQQQTCKFRNHDHKFEWTREQFNRWATDLASRHNYSVMFDGVGGVAGVEPGFASQIAVFRRGQHQSIKGNGESKDIKHQYDTIWEWEATS